MGETNMTAYRLPDIPGGVAGKKRASPSALMKRSWRA